VTCNQNQDLRASSPPSEPEKSTANQGPELAMGTVVMFQQPGNAVEAVETRVTGKTTQQDGTRLYRLEACAEGQPLVVPRDCLTVVADEAGTRAHAGVIKATAAQLLQVLGKACPFVGPGLWEVKRDEVPAQAWGQLLRIVEEG
jgi:hypothetical protein